MKGRWAAIFSLLVSAGCTSSDEPAEPVEKPVLRVVVPPFEDEAKIESALMPDKIVETAKPAVFDLKNLPKGARRVAGGGVFIPAKPVSSTRGRPRGDKPDPNSKRALDGGMPAGYRDPGAIIGGRPDPNSKPDPKSLSDAALKKLEQAKKVYKGTDGFDPNASREKEPGKIDEKALADDATAEEINPAKSESKLSPGDGPMDGGGKADGEEVEWSEGPDAAAERDLGQTKDSGQNP